VLRNWTAGVTYVIESAPPFSAYVDGDINGDSNRFNDLAPGTTRNQFRAGTQVAMNARLARTVKLTDAVRMAVIWEVFNLFNQPSYIAVNDTLYSVAGTTLQRNPLFGQWLEQSEPRTMRIAARVEW
jgi:hypothetical protein